MWGSEVNHLPSFRYSCTTDSRFYAAVYLKYRLVQVKISLLQPFFFSESLFILFTEVTVYMKSMRFLTNKTILGCEGTAI